MKVNVKYIPNILSVEGRDEIDLHFSALGKERLSYILSRCAFYDAGRGNPPQGQRIILNGSKIDSDDFEKTWVPDGSHIVICESINDPISMAITAFISSYTIGQVIAWTAFAITTAYSIYSALNKPKVPTYGGLGEGTDQSSATYSWDGVLTTQDVGVPIPIIYGRHRVGGNIINQFIRNDGDQSYLYLLLGICQGEIKGISDARINDNPVTNFDGITEFTRLGTSNQSVIPNFIELNSSNTINAPLEKDDPYTYTTIDNEVEAFEVSFNFPSGIYAIDAGTGGEFGWTVVVLIEYKLTTSGTWISAGEQSYSAKSQSAVKRNFRLEGLTAGKYDIRITRTSDNSSITPNTLVGDLVLASINEIQTDDLIYPNMALYAIKALATNQLSGSTPNVTMVVEGKLVNVPKVMNGGDEVDWEDYYWDPDYASGTGAYRLLSDGTVLSWDGSTYVDRFCANPIWCVKDLLRNDRYGLGDSIESGNISDADYLAMSRVCEEKVPDGDGGYEKLYRMDVVIDSETNALDLINQLATTFDAFVFYSEGTVRLKIDEDEEPVMHYGMGNILENSFSCQWKSKKEAFNMVQVQYADEDRDYRLETISVVDDDAISNGEPLRQKQLRIFVTKKSYALRAARRALKVSQLIVKAYDFAVSIDSLAISPGDVIGLSHDVPQVGFSGRIITGSTTTSIKLDQTVTIEASKTYKLTIQFADDTIEERTVNNSPGDTDTLTVSSAFSQTPASYDKYVFGITNIHYKKLRVVSLTMDSKLDAKLSAIEVDSNVYDYSAPVIPQDKYSLLSTEIQDVEDLVLSELLIQANDGTLKNTIRVWWRRPQDASYYLNKWAKARVYLSDTDGASWDLVGEVSGESFVIDQGVITGQQYKIAIVSVSANGMANAIADSPSGTVTILGKAAAPSNVQNFDVTQQGDILRFSFDPIPDGDLARYIIKKGSEWATATLIGERVDSTVFEYPVGEIGQITFLIKAIDTSGNESSAAASDTITVTPPPEMNFVSTIDPWAQNREYKLTNIARIKTNLYDPDYARDVFALQTAETWQDIEDLGKSWDELEADGDLDFDKTYEASGSIEQVEPIDLGSIFEFNVISELLYKNVTGGAIALQISYSEDGSSYTAFANVSSATNYRARYVKFKYNISTSDTNHNVLFYAGTITINAPLVKTDFGRDVAIGAGGTAIVFRDDFTSEPRITGLSIVNGVIGDIEVVSKTAAGMTLKVWSPVTDAYIGTAEIDWEVKGT